MREHPYLFYLQDDRDFSWSGQLLALLLAICKKLFIYPLKKEITLQITTEMKTSSHVNWNGEHFIYTLIWETLHIFSHEKRFIYPLEELIHWNENAILLLISWKKNSILSQVFNMYLYIYIYIYIYIYNKYTIYVYYICTMYIPRGMELKEKEA